MNEYYISSDFIPGLVSIIIPTHNREDIIVETIDSVFAQDYGQIELIIVDDHSTDNTETIVRKKQEESKLNGFQYVKSNKRGGQAARNIGLTHSKGEFIQFFDDDDIMCSDHISKKVQALSENKDAEYVTCNFVYFEDTVENVVSKKKVHNIVHTIESHILSYAFPTPIFLCKRSCFSKIGFWNEKIARLQDMSYFQRLFLNDIKGVYLSDYLFKVRKHSNCITSNTSLKILKAKVYAYNTVKREYVQANKYTRLLGDALFICKAGCFVEAIQFKYYLWAVVSLLKLVITNPIRIARLGIVKLYHNYVKKDNKNFYEIFFS